MKHTILIMLAVLLNIPATAQKTGSGNPYLPLWEHLPDGEPRVFDDPDNPGKKRIYITGSHDVRVKGYCGHDIHMWSAPVEDLNAWRDEGAIFKHKANGKWDIMFAPDIVEVTGKDGRKEYYLYPHSRGHGREAMVCRSSRPDGPFVPINLNDEGTATVGGSILGFDPSVYVEQITDPSDPDFGTGFRAYGYWGFQKSHAVELDPQTMYSARKGCKVIEDFIPAGEKDGGSFNFFEASSIRKIGNKYVMIFSGYSGPEYGLWRSNSTLRYAYGDSPLGPWKSGGVLVDSRGVVPDMNGTSLTGSNSAHNTHGSIENINGQWYVFYHRPPRGFGFARQAMVAPISISWDKAPVSEGGKVVIRGYDPYSKDGIWEAKATDGSHYTGAEVTSEGFNIYGLDPYRYYSAGYACHFSDSKSLLDSWDIWDNSMKVKMSDKDIVGYKYFGFGGLRRAEKGLRPFKGTTRGNGSTINLFLKPQTKSSFKINVWLDGPWENDVWNGKKIAEILVPAGSGSQVTRFTADVSSAIDGIDGKHAIYLVAEGEGELCELVGLGFTKKNEQMTCPLPPAIHIAVNGKEITLPEEPVRADEINGYTGYGNYETVCMLPSGLKTPPKVTAWSDDSSVKVEIRQPRAITGKASVTFDWKGITKTYKIRLTE